MMTEQQSKKSLFQYLEQVNFIRKNPKIYLKQLTNQKERQLDKKNYQSKKIIASKDKNVNNKNNNQTIQFLKLQNPLINELQWSQSLYLGIKNYSKYVSQKIQYQPLISIEKYVQYQGQIKIWINFGQNQVKQFLKTTIYNQNQRKSIFDQKFKHFACIIKSQKQNIKEINKYFMIIVLAENVKKKKKEKITANKLIKQINKLRKNPKSYISQIQSQILLFKKKQIKLSDSNTIITKQGKKAWIQAIDFLKNQQPVNELEYLKDLNRIALKKIKYPHLDFSKFIIKYSNIKGKAKFLQNLGSTNSKQTIVSFLVSDGDITRSSRSLLFSKDFNYIGGFMDMTVGNQNCGLLFVQQQTQDILRPIQRIQRSQSVNSINSIKSLKQYILKKQQTNKLIKREIKRINSNKIILPQIIRKTQKQQQKQKPLKRTLRRFTQNNQNYQKPKSIQLKRSMKNILKTEEVQLFIE